MKKILEVIDFFNKADQNCFVELNYDGDFSIIEKKAKEFVKDLSNLKDKNNYYSILDFDDVLYACENIHIEGNIIVINFKKITNDFFINEFENFEKIN